MGMLKIDDAKEGMIIVEDVLNKLGNVLLKKGTALTANLIGTLQSLEIPGVRVEDGGNSTENGDDSPDNSSPAVSTQFEELEYKFSDVKGNPIMEEIMATVKEHITEKGSINDTS